MLLGNIIRGALFALPIALLVGFSAMDATAQDRCVSWSEARSAGLITKFKLRPASEIKARVEAKYGGKVVSFQICKSSGRLIYKLAVFRANGNVRFVTEPAQ